jgi:hypothetical protein
VRATIDTTLSNRTINLSNEQVTANSRYASGVIQYVIAFNIITTTNTAAIASPKI